MTHVPGGAPGPADQPQHGQPGPASSQPADYGQQPPPASNYTGAAQPGPGQTYPGQSYPTQGQPAQPGQPGQPAQPYGGQAPGQPGAWQGGAGQQAQPGGATSIGLEPPIAGLLAYAFGWISGLIILLMEKQNQAVRFHAAQSIAIFASLSVLGALTSVLQVIPVIGILVALVWLLLGPLAIFLWIFMMIRAYNQVQTRIPLAANIADKILGAAN